MLCRVLPIIQTARAGISGPPALASQVLVDGKNAETLYGRYCSKNKCRVFEQIICANT